MFCCLLRVEGLRREARYNVVTKSPFLPAASTMNAFYYFWSAYCMQGNRFCLTKAANANCTVAPFYRMRKLRLKRA